MYGFSDVYPSLEHFWADKLKLRRSDRHDYKILGLHFDLEPKEDKSEQEVRLIVGIPVINGTTYPELQESATNLEAWLSKDEWFEFHDEYPRLYFGALAIDDTRESRITEFPEIEDLIAN